MITSPIISLTLMRFTYPSQICFSLSKSSSCSFPSLAPVVALGAPQPPQKRGRLQESLMLRAATHHS